MKVTYRLFTILVGVMLGCSGDNSLGPIPQEKETSSNDLTPNDGTVCQRGNDCCKQDELICYGNPDNMGMCFCDKAWVCEATVNPKKCEQNPQITPDGGGGWTCDVLEKIEKCVRSGSEQIKGKGSWVCTTKDNNIECTRQLNVPDGSGDWNCIYNEGGKVCEKGNSTSDAGSTRVTPGESEEPDGKINSGGNDEEPSGNGDWICSQSQETGILCKRSGNNVPAGGSGSWTCEWSETTFTCKGSSSTTPGGGDWKCEADGHGSKWICTMTKGSNETSPGEGEWICMNNSTEGKTICVQGPQPKSGEECIPNQRRWCKGPENDCSCHYGIQVCKPDGTWGTCQKADGRKPNTVCACYFNTYNAKCCERPDCLIPEGTDGQVCPKSNGEQCDYCSLGASECKQGGYCYLSNSKENFCIMSCMTNKTCPTGYKCNQYLGRYYCFPESGTCF